jgi:DNA polymerase/3'-5' exonuclease PolX
MSSEPGELLNLLVLHHAKLNELHGNGNFRSKKYLRHRNSIQQIQRAIKAITDRQALPQSST